LAAAFTAAAGASEYFMGGVVAYDNAVKVGVLGVEPETLAAHGAVSRQVAEQMAAGVRRVMGVDFAVATTGIAGPGGGSVEKPVGTVWVAVASPNGTTAEVFHFAGTRAEIMSAATEAAIGMLRDALGSGSTNGAV
jgi:nicotinamide-nucleotide amidase